MQSLHESSLLNQPILTLSDLAFTYRDAAKPALDQIDYRHRRGEFTVIVGETGAGKSTLCRCLNGLIPSFTKGRLDGSLQVAGHRESERPQVYELARIVGLVFQDFEAQLFSTNVELETAFALENFAVERDQMKTRVERALNRVGLSGFEQRDPASLSGGEKQRLAIASVLAGSPSVVVMDEPTTDLDPVGKRDIFKLAQILRNEIEGIILVEHETEHVLSADRILLMHEGRIVQEGPPGEILADPRNVERHGVRPLQTTVLLSELGLETDALTIQDAVARIRSAGWRVGESARESLEDARRSEPPGEPPGEPPCESPGESRQSVVHIENLVYRYGEAPPAVDGVSLDISAGEFVALVGQNGCGKTTLAKHLNGLHAPTEGEVRVLDKSTTDWTLPELGRRVGYVFQNPDHQIFANTVRDEVAFGALNYGFSEEKVVEKVDAALAETGLSGRDFEDPFNLTRGERQQLAVASVLATDPEILVLDEPTTGLDYHGQVAILNLVRRLNESGRTVVMITHSMWVVAEYADRCVIMSGGRVVQDGDVRSCFSNPELLESLYLEAPEAVRLGYEFGLVARSVKEIAGCLERVEE
ncbi:MAG: ABC transporter ATP-binding protein [Gemmatimonadetes bacterium]|nr:ABC transporter ATP-binding protein [Gemmatimonadota bacterium]MYG86814.1 ABC transporter ATP-binding protein [Gemmatimonadota bacterium]MYJ88419.1 ABC transporter ATP-binding protein [Gemmatimonadota bacterium]